MAIVVDRSAQVNTPRAFFGPLVAINQDLGAYTIYYMNFRDNTHNFFRLWALWHDVGHVPRFMDITDKTGFRPPTSTGGPLFAYNEKTRNQDNVLTQGDNEVVRLFWPLPNGTPGVEKLNGVAHAPGGGNAVGYYVPARDTHHVIFMPSNGHLHELFWTGEEAVSYGGDLTSKANAPTSKSFPSPFWDGNKNIAIYTATDNRIHDIAWTTEQSAFSEDLSGVAGTPVVKNGSPVIAYRTSHNETNQVYYIGGPDSHLYEISWHRDDPVVGRNLTKDADAPLVVGSFTAWYSVHRNIKYVVYPTNDGQIHLISWVPGTSDMAYRNICQDFMLPKNWNLSSRSLKGFTNEKTNEEHLIYFGQGLPGGGRVMDVSWTTIN
jgi:hypothetical protein